MLGDGGEGTKKVSTGSPSCLGDIPEEVPFTLERSLEFPPLHRKCCHGAGEAPWLHLSWNVNVPPGCCRAGAAGPLPFLCFSPGQIWGELSGDMAIRVLSDPTL